jgi:hypothetical protein
MIACTSGYISFDNTTNILGIQGQNPLDGQDRMPDGALEPVLAGDHFPVDFLSEMCRIGADRLPGNS